MAVLALVSLGQRSDKGRVKFILALFSCSVFVVSCVPVNQHQGGGASFDDSALGPALDANTALPEDRIDGAQSFQEWKEREQ